MTIRQIKYFIAIYEHKNMTKASESMYVSRPVLSRALIEFEDELGVQLFIRTTNGVEATAQGHALYKTLSALSVTFGETLKRIRGEETVKEKRIFKIGVLDYIGGWIYPKLLTPFKEVYSDIDVCVNGIRAEEVVNCLIEGKLDCAIAPILGDNYELIKGVHLYNYEWYLCCPQYSDIRKITVDSLGNLPIAVMETFAPPFYHGENIVLSTRQPELLHMAITEGHAYGVVPSDMVTDWDDVSCVPFSPEISAGVFLLFNTALQHNETLNSFLQFVSTIDFRDF